MIVETLRSNDATATRTLLKNWIWVLSVFIAIIPTHLLCKCKQTFLRLNSKGPYPSSEREIKFRRCLFTFSIKRKIGHLHAVVVLKQQKNVEKSVMHVKSREKLFCWLNLFFLFFFSTLSLWSCRWILKSLVSIYKYDQNHIFFKICFKFNSVNSQALVCMRKPNSEGFYKIPFARWCHFTIPDSFRVVLSSAS